MTPEQMRLVQQSFALVRPVKWPVAEEFFDRLCELEPTLKPQLQGDTLGRCAMLMALLATAVNRIDRLHVMVPVVESLARRHGLHDPHYAAGATALLWSLEQGLGPAFTPDVRDAWESGCTLFVGIMHRAGRKLAA